MSAGCMSFGNYRGESISLLIQAVSRIQFLAIIGLRSPFLCWLSAEGSSHLLEAIQIIWLVAPFLHLQSSSGFEVGKFPLTLNLSSFFIHLISVAHTASVITSTFKHSCD